jgi:hypothetical protein
VSITALAAGSSSPHEIPAREFAAEYALNQISPHLQSVDPVRQKNDFSDLPNLFWMRHLWFAEPSSSSRRGFAFCCGLQLLQAPASDLFRLFIAF